MGCSKSPYFFFHKVKHIFSFSLITLLIKIFWVCQLSPEWYNVDCSQLMSWFDGYWLQLLYLMWSIIQWEISSMKLRKPLFFWHIWSVISPSTFSIHFKYLSWNNKEWSAKNVAHFLLYSILKWFHKNFTNFDFLKIHTDTTAVTIQSNKIVSNEFKDN